MKYIIIGDVHLHSSKFYNESGSNLVFIAIQDILKYILSHKSDAVIFLGDIFSLKDRIPNNIRNIFFKLLKQYKEGRQYYIIEGNHDNNGIDSSLYPFSSIAKIVTKNIKVDNIVMSSYFDSNVPPKGKLLLAHKTLQGSKINNFTFEEGLDISLSDYKYVVCGHIHCFQQVKKNRWHLGSIYQEDWSEASQQKYFALYDSNKEELFFKEIPLAFFNRKVIGVNEDIVVNKDDRLIVKILIDNNTSSKELETYKQYLKNQGVSKIFIQPKLVENFQNIVVDSSNQGLKKYLNSCLEEVKTKNKPIYKKILEDILQENNL